ncbi:class I SAM-dependent methyltransferase [Acidaminococcus sp. NSJ-142]|jgi:tRNA (adenine22-N1)-methyltransferase|uniref:tRNA (adenine(22)-N(1))-methyltransferase n=1 Tax=Acidaminococcus TaxID=904 RepID=UPI000CFA10A4|nr:MULTISPECIES: class I SAM-dependent methyltransferase [Acidaminococcus]MCD2434731.1 class I SAM-dependent methyltransferase [Acidaminococcus hominis]MCH4095368.1 class I SAM-dependent methyltransferase [Acidaminococcus provencensis]RHK03341.1 SAM-dependent methyltransferase [Acidaminococcus sp. AM05-11]
MHFGARLETVARNIPPCSSFADIGTDHAYLPVLLLQQCKIEKAVAGDVVPGPCEAARKTVHSFGFTGKLDVRLGSGLTVVQPGECQVFAICGMGAGTMVQILDESPQVWQHPSCQALVLQPMSDSALLRHWCEQHGWAIAHEDLAQEGERLYEILVLKPQPGWKYPGTCYLVGQDLVDQHHPLLEPFVTQLQDKYLKLLASMEKSPRAIHTPQYREYQETAKQLEEILRGNNGN